ncbi:MAG: ribonuclease III [Lachnospiraceae bacterium]|nr:ribonuclease III [Lachnospiraceae bacterium]
MDKSYIEKVRELEKRIGYEFENFDLLIMALRHSSYVNEHHMDRIVCNERLEFLGDAVLECVSSEYLYQQFPMKPEGELTKLRASLVCEPTLAYDAREIQLGEYLVMGKGEEMTGGRARDSITSDAFESVIGAIFLDGGFANAKEFILNHVLDDVEHKRFFYDSKTILQEVLQEKQEAVISYRITDEAGPDHDKTFTAEVCLGGTCLGKGQGRTKKAAEQQAAYDALCRIKQKK